MNDLFPHTSHAEDQPYARTILTLHVLRSGLAMGSFISLASASAITLIRPPRSLPTYFSRLLIHSRYGAIAGLSVSAVMVVGRMWGREKIEWQDRSWRLQESRSQSRADWWVLGGSVLGAMGAVAAARRGVIMVPARVGRGGLLWSAAGLGSVVGTLGHVATGGMRARLKVVVNEEKELI
ncbi:hypothetical protein M501DRAFT_958667 [Patellaria atrata CBS 101060]|uniref:Uncharacterized protein n=1 Tax=Patellaria atrata CBS 101060 TaxID=1346257 RepID=A0A9P4S758_9PEZI|nr:hypothetical protein M501DRAFT_958667 [Patellaria atrata CBS 101060]